MNHDEMIACHECDVLHRKVELARMTTARCSRCNAVLYRRLSGRIDRVLALALAALITLVIANAFPIVELKSNGFTSQATLISAVAQLWSEDNMTVATLVLCLTLLFPAAELLALLWLLLPIHAGRRPAGFAPILRTVIGLRPWGMIEVFMLGVLVALVKLSGVARVIPDVALFAFGVLTVLLAAVMAFDLRSLWDIVDQLPARPPSARRRLRYTASGTVAARPLLTRHRSPPR
jgi:paraquat-inducible protein A